MNNYQYRKVDWERTRQIIEAHLSSLKSVCEKNIGTVPDIGGKIIDRYIRKSCEGVWAELDLWFLPIDGRRSFVKDESPHRYENLTGDELDKASRVVEEFATLFPGLEFLLGLNHRGLLRYKIKPKVLPLLAKAAPSNQTPTDEQILTNKVFEERLRQFRRDSSGLALEWEEDHPKIAEKLGVSLKELERQIKRLKIRGKN